MAKQVNEAAAFDWIEENSQKMRPFASPQASRHDRAGVDVAAGRMNNEQRQGRGAAALTGPRGRER